MRQHLDALRAELPLDSGVQLLLDSLDSVQQERFAELVLTSVKNQEQRIDAAGEQALRMVPRVFRGPVKKLLFGDNA